MTPIQIASNPFAQMMDPEAVFAAIERSERLSRLQSRICRPLDKPLIAVGEPAESIEVVEAADAVEMIDAADAVDVIKTADVDEAAEDDDTEIATRSSASAYDAAALDADAFDADLEPSADTQF